MYNKFKLSNKEPNSIKKNVLNNVIRTVLYRNLRGFGVKQITVKENTSEYETTYICDRIEQIPFKAEGVYNLECIDTTEVYTNSFKEDGIYRDILILKQDTPFNFSASVKVIASTGLVHAKYSPVQIVQTDSDNNLTINLFDYYTIDSFKTELKSII